MVEDTNQSSSGKRPSRKSPTGGMSSIKGSANITGQPNINSLFRLKALIERKKNDVRVGIVRCLWLLLTIFIISACVPVEQVSTPVPEPKIVDDTPAFSAAPLRQATAEQKLFAQTALTQLGYKVGTVDGIWGPRSSTAIKSFEVTRGLISADGFLSLLSINELQTLTGLNLEAVSAEIQNRKAKGIRSKLKGKLKDTGPQLIIVENEYDVFSEPNPYSEKLLKLQNGTGIYVVNEIEGWYQIESINRRTGFVQAD